MELTIKPPEQVGKFVADGDLVLTDPCYALDTWCIQRVKVLPGEWDVYVQKWINDLNPKYRHERTGTMFIFHSSVSAEERAALLQFPRCPSWMDIGHIGIDSGQIGIINASTHMRTERERERSKEWEAWYHTMCESHGELETWEKEAGYPEKPAAAMYPYGAFISSLWGDTGCFTWKFLNPSGEIVGVLIDSSSYYFDREEDDEDDLEDDDS